MYKIQVFTGLNPKVNTLIDVGANQDLTFETLDEAAQHAMKVRTGSSLGVRFKVVPIDKEEDVNAQ
ncbi:hypothetical protein [Bacillus thuringiensis]|uniref:hypothetical protein n=1 Tax=Bacillus thuringiensis TaxID=1428 RepID=UPI002E18AC56|nr:hypothetical protein [Bacillus thuringiensis]